VIDFKQSRIAMRMPQSELARRALVPLRRVRAAEQGEYELTPDEADRIEQTLRHEAARMRILSKKLKATEAVRA
jgi:hypothetical protein